VYLMLSVSMYYLFLIVTSVFSNVYLFCMSSFCVVYLMLPVSMYYLFLIVTSVFFIVYLFFLSSSCVPYFAVFSGLSIFDFPFGFLWIVNF
jgi:hypothetical protein